MRRASGEVFFFFGVPFDAPFFAFFLDFCVRSCGFVFAMIELGQGKVEEKYRVVMLLWNSILCVPKISKPGPRDVGRNAKDPRQKYLVGVPNPPTPQIRYGY